MGNRTRRWLQVFRATPEEIQEAPEFLALIQQDDSTGIIAFLEGQERNAQSEVTAFAASHPYERGLASRDIWELPENQRTLAEWFIEEIEHRRYARERIQRCVKVAKDIAGVELFRTHRST